MYLFSLSAVDTGEKSERGGYENVSCSVHSRIEQYKCILVFSSCDKQELIEKLLSVMLL